MDEQRGQKGAKSKYPPLQKNHDQGGGYLGHVENLKILVHILLVCFFHFSSWVVAADRKMNFKRKYKNHDRHDWPPLSWFFLHFSCASFYHAALRLFIKISIDFGPLCLRTAKGSKNPKPWPRFSKKEKSVTGTLSGAAAMPKGQEVAPGRNRSKSK